MVKKERKLIDMGKSKIEWCNETYNPVVGCSPISAGCDNCYAKAMNKRFFGGDFSVKFHPERLEEPLKRKKATLYFVCSMGDLFHDDVELWWIEEVLSVIMRSPKHHFMILTKRPEKMKEFFCEKIEDYYMPDNLWLGVTAENQEQADKRIPILLEIPAAGYFVSLEPLLEPIKLNSKKWLDYCEYPHCDYYCGSDGDENYICSGKHVENHLNFVIGGPETGSKSRPMKDEWIDNIEEQCDDADIPFFHKKDKERQQVPRELKKFF